MVVTVHGVEVDHQFYAVVCVNSHIFLLKCVQNDISVELASRVDLSNLNVGSAAINRQKSEKDADKLMILSSDVSPDKSLLAVATSTKHLILLDLRSVLKCGGIGTCEDTKCQTVHKTPTAVHFSPCGGTLLVSTRSGSLMEYGLSTGANFCPGTATELLSHFSMLLDHCLSPGRPKFLLSVDRDEKVRVSRYPNTQVIECFCLGHTSFVTSVCCLDDEIAISGGGDGVLRVWQFKIGRCLCVSSKLNSAPVRKVFPFRENKIFVLFDGASEISLFDFDPRGPSVELSRTFVGGDGQFFDFFIDAKYQRIFAVGGKGLFRCDFGADSAERVGMKNITELGGESVSTLLTQLNTSTEPFPLAHLYKTVAFGNLENYERKKGGERRKRRGGGTGRLIAD